MDLRSWLIFQHAFITPAEYRALGAAFQDASDALQSSHAKLTKSGLSEVKAAALTDPDDKRVEAGLQWLKEPRHHLVTIEDSHYPELLRQIPGPPLAFYVNGEVLTLDLPMLAIVGSRNPSRGGIQNAVEFSKHLANSGFAIASGLAQGIDTAAHRGALAANGRTVAFLGHGIDRVYPAANRSLAHEIAEHGALISEYPLGSPPERWHFPERNRLISGISVGTLVVEAARQSGSLITARLSAEQGREVFAIPGSIHNPLARGCHTLIRQGAKLTETAADIVSELGALTAHVERQLADSGDVAQTSDHAGTDPDSDYVTLREALGHDPVHIDELAALSGLTIAKLSSMLLILELHGEVESLSGGRYALLA